MTRLISMWSGPRNVSTAMMYAWRQRSDTTVVDEPMYGHYLAYTGVDHPGRDLILASVPTDADEIVAGMLRHDDDVAVRFSKNMAHHLEGFGLDLVDGLDNYLLTRDPRDMLPSLAKGLGRVPELRDTGFAAQVEIVDRVLAGGRRPIVVDSRVLLDHPRPVLEQLCAALDLPFEESMLSWPPGPKPEDGVWAPFWYDRLHETTGFEPYQPKTEPFPTELEPLHEQCAPLFDQLGEFTIGV
jgi:hypothetical protein